MLDRSVGRTRLVLAALVVALAACGGQRSVTTGDHTIWVHGPSLVPPGGMDAVVEGALALREGCVVLEGPDGQSWYPVVWPSGTRIDSTDPLVLALPSGDDLALGAAVTGGGGYLQPASMDVEIPASCLPATGEVAVFNARDNPLVN